ncbi:MAG: NAD-binding protein [Chitinophagales bacterium]|nr:NAD-binding protein [Chitinophagales bacterium]
MPKSSFKERLQYKFENIISSGPSAMIGLLAVLTLIIVILAGIFLSLTGIPNSEGEQMNFLESSWQSFMRAVDAGALGADIGWPLRMVMLIVTIGGLFILATLIGILTSGLEGKLDDLRKGKSKVLEENHTLILGWSSKIFAIIEELSIANENQKSAKIVVLADRDKVEMEDEIREQVENLRTTQVIVRSGSPLESPSIEVVNPYEAKSIIVLSPEDTANPDTHVIKSVLAITNSKKRKKETYHIVAEIKDLANLEAAELVGGKETTYVFSSDLIARVTAQTCRQSGLSLVYSDLLQFEGDEIYFNEEASLVGLKFRDALFKYESSSVFGIFTKAGEVLINPPGDTLIEAGDQIIAISEDDDTIILSGKSEFDIQHDVIQTGPEEGLKQESTLILGWNDKGIRIIEELDNYVAKGSKIMVLAEIEGLEQELIDLDLEIPNHDIHFQFGNISDKSTLKKLGVENYDHIIALSYSGEDIQESDAKTLICLLHLRNMSEQVGKEFSIVSEMLDIRNKELAEVAKADDFIVSDNLVSLMLTQMSENKFLKKVYDILFEADGSEIYLRPAKNYVKLGEKLNFYTVLEASCQRNEVAIGYRLAKDFRDSEANYGLYLNPNKAEELVFEEGDMIIVLAED